MYNSYSPLDNYSGSSSLGYTPPLNSYGTGYGTLGSSTGYVDSSSSFNYDRNNAIIDSLDRPNYKFSKSGQHYGMPETYSKGDNLFMSGNERLKSFTPTMTSTGDMKRSFCPGDNYAFSDPMYSSVRVRKNTNDNMHSKPSTYASQFLGSTSSSNKVGGFGGLQSFGRTVQQNPIGLDVPYRGGYRESEFPNSLNFNESASRPTFTGKGQLEFGKSFGSNDLRSTGSSNNQQTGVDLGMMPPPIETEGKKPFNHQATKQFSMNFGVKSEQRKQLPLTFGSSQAMPIPTNLSNTQQPRSAGTAQFKKKMIVNKDGFANPELRQTGGQEKTLKPEGINQQTQAKTPGRRSIKTPCKKLGKGKFGDVFIVKNKQVGFICAMKIVSKAHLTDQKVQNQFIRQLKIQMYLTHFNTTKLFGFFHDHQNFYLLIELCCEGMLLNIVKSRRRLPQNQAKSLMRQICRGVDYLHHSNIIHRDLKLQNIIMEMGVAKICDFGTSVYNQDEFRMTVIGTPVYKPPEQIQGNKYDDKADIWALGIISYEMLVGKHPFKINQEKDLQKICQQQVVFPEYVQISDLAKEFVLSILKKNPEQRLDVERMLAHPYLKEQKEQPKFQIPNFL